MCISAGKKHSAAVTSDGQCFTWGDNELGQLGVSYVENYTCTPQPVSEIEKRVLKVACGYTQTLFITEDHELMACGNNDQGQLGVDEEIQIVDVPVRVTKIEEPIASICCSNFNCALSQNQSLYIWGDTPNGMFTKPEKINGLEGIIRQVTIGEDLICVLDTNNYVYSWGRNETGQLGLGDTENQKDACSIDALNDRDVVGLFAGKNFIMGLGRGATDKIENPLLEKVGADDIGGELVQLEDDDENYEIEVDEHIENQEEVEIDQDIEADASLKDKLIKFRNYNQEQEEIEESAQEAPVSKLNIKPESEQHKASKYSSLNNEQPTSQNKPIKEQLNSKA